MSDEFSLLAAILSHPDEDTPRLVFADWLDENGFAARAEFIRLQTEITRQPERHPYPPAFKAKSTRFRELFAEHGKAWLAVVGVPLGRAIFRRGFVEEIRATPDEVLDIGATALSREMLSMIEVSPRFDRSPDIDTSPAGDAVLRRLAEWPVRGRVRHLRMSALTLTTPAVATFVNSGAAAGLRTLDLYGCTYNHAEVRDAVAAAQLPDVIRHGYSVWPPE